MMASKRRKMDGSSESYGSEQEESSREQGSVASDVSAAEYAGRSAPTSVIPDLDPGLLRTFADNIEALKKENTELQGKLRAAHASQIPAQLGGHLASLVTMARTNQTTSKSQRTAAWQSLMEKALPQLVHANGLEALLTPLSIESEEEMIAGKETLTEGLAEWKKAPMGLANRLIGPEGRSSALSEWLPNVKAEDYNAAYSFDAVQLLLTTLSCRISVTQFKWGAQNPPANPHLPSRPLTAALGSHHLTMLGPVALSTTTDGLLDTSSVRWTAWRSRIKEAVDGGAQVIVSCAQLTISATIAPQEPDSVSSATGAAASSSSWFALQLDLLNKDCRVYRCSRDVSRSSVQTVFDGVAEGLELPDSGLWQVFVDDPLRVERRGLTGDQSGPLSVFIASLVADQLSDEVIKQGHVRLAGEWDVARVDRLCLSQHLLLLNSYKCNRQLLQLCSEGRANL